MFYNELAIVLTNKCNANCNICCFSCNPTNNDVLDYTTVQNLINQSETINRIESIAFTGGEPFLFEDLLLKSIKYAKGKFKKISCNTNGYAFSNIQTTKMLLKNLKDAGLSFLNISVDLFHSKYVSSENISNALKISKELNIITTLRVGIMKNDILYVGKLLNEYGEYIFNTFIQIYPFNIGFTIYSRQYRL